MNRYSVAVIPGDGIGQDVTYEALKVLKVVADQAKIVFEFQDFELGANRYLKSGETLTDADLSQLSKCDAIVLGAVGDPRVPPGVLERGLLLKLRFEFDHHVNLRPVKLLPGVKTPLADKDSSQIDMVFCREGTEGPYAGAGGNLRFNTSHEVATEESINTSYGVERVINDAFRRAMKRRKHLTLVHKTNVLVHSGGLWKRTFDRIKEDYPEVSVDYQHVDAAAMFMVNQPERFDVVVTDNLFGDILTDIGAAIAGGIGLAASGNLDPSGKFPSMFEPVHGSAPDIAGKQIADPTAAILSVAMLLDHLGHLDAANKVEAAVAADLVARAGVRRTSEIGDAIAGRL
ncbi:MAG: 3-isopropylmalate dehydrogenase [Actinobacteria bacterium]|nr:3-isopropylmalate dehydrogenase [Actinomycetota bacterium]